MAGAPGDALHNDIRGAVRLICMDMSGASVVLESALTFQCEGQTLIGIVHENPRETRRLGVVVVVGGPQYRVGSHRQFVLMARMLAAEGYPVLRFDYRGMGDSDGSMRSFDSVSADIRAAVDAMNKAIPGLDGVVLWGLCDAASASLMYCTSDQRVAGLILANPWVRTAAGEARSYLRHYYLQRLLQKSFWQKVFSGGFKPGKSLQELSGAVRQASTDSAPAGSTGYIDQMLSGLQGFAGPILLLISERDLTAREFTDRCGQHSAWQKATRRKNVQREDLPGADHTFSSREALSAATAGSLRWLNAMAPRAGR